MQKGSELSATKSRTITCSVFPGWFGHKFGRGQTFDEHVFGKRSWEMSWIRSILGAGVRGGKKLVGSDLKGNQYFERIVEGSNDFRAIPRKETL